MIGLYKGVSLTSRLIRWQTNSDYSHAAWVRPDLSCIESWRKGVAAQPSFGTAHTPGTVVDLFTVDGLTPEHVAGIERFLVAQIGARYDLHGVLKFASRRKPDSSDEKRWFCSELIAAALEAVHMPLLRAPAWKISPGLLSFSPFLRPMATLRTAGPGREVWR